MPDSPFPGNAWAQFMGQHGIALPSEKSGGGHLALDFFWRRRGSCCVVASYTVQLALKEREQDTTHLI